MNLVWEAELPPPCISLYLVSGRFMFEGERELENELLKIQTMILKNNNHQEQAVVGSAHSPALW